MTTEYIVTDTTRYVCAVTGRQQPQHQQQCILVRDQPNQEAEHWVTKKQAVDVNTEVETETETAGECELVTIAGDEFQELCRRFVSIQDGEVRGSMCPVNMRRCQAPGYPRDHFTLSNADGTMWIDADQKATPNVTEAAVWNQEVNTKRRGAGAPLPRVPVHQFWRQNERFRGPLQFDVVRRADGKEVNYQNFRVCSAKEQEQNKNLREACLTVGVGRGDSLVPLPCICEHYHQDEDGCNNDIECMPTT